MAKDYTFKRSNEFSLVECLNCHLVYLNPQPDQKELSVFYPLEFFDQPEDKVRSRMPGFFVFNRGREIKRLKSSGKLLDIGCGSAVYLKKLQSEGWIVHGTDNSDLACKIAAANIGKENVFQGDLFSAGFLPGSYDVITLWHVIEHLPDPENTLKFCKTLLKDDGLLIIACPNFGSLLQKLFRNFWYPLAVPAHLVQFKFGTLKRLLLHSGLKVVRRKKHFVDPFTNMGSLKLTLMRFLGLGDLTMIVPGSGVSRVQEGKRSFFWNLFRALFNVFCFMVSLFLSILGNEEIILVWAAKDDK